MRLGILCVVTLALVLASVEGSAQDKRDSVVVYWTEIVSENPTIRYVYQEGWDSQGQFYKYNAVEKNGKRYVVYSLDSGGFPPVRFFRYGRTADGTWEQEGRTIWYPYANTPNDLWYSFWPKGNYLSSYDFQGYLIRAERQFRERHGLKETNGWRMMTAYYKVPAWHGIIEE